MAQRGAGDEAKQCAEAGSNVNLGVCTPGLGPCFKRSPETLNP